MTALRNLYTEKETAEHLKLSTASLANMARNGEIEYTQVGKRRRYSQDNIESYILNNRKGGGKFETVRNNDPDPIGPAGAEAEKSGNFDGIG